MAANSLEKHCKIMAENANTCMRGHTIDYKKNVSGTFEKPKYLNLCSFIATLL